METGTKSETPIIDYKFLRKMELHQEIALSKFLWIRRVPNGWIYLDRWQEDGSTTCTFVPLIHGSMDDVTNMK